MAKMIPDYIDFNPKIKGEIEIFNLLKNSNKTENWIVIYSLELSQHITQVSGEIDFVIIVPHSGILCVEVKGASRVYRDSQGWHYGSSIKLDRRGPFKQASDNMHTLKNYIKEIAPETKNILFCHSVIFPFCPFKEISPEWDDWQYIDRKKLETRDIGDLIHEMLIRAKVNAESKNAIRFHAGNSEPSLHQCEVICNILRPNFDFCRQDEPDLDAPKHSETKLGNSNTDNTHINNDKNSTNFCRGSSVHHDKINIEEKINNIIIIFVNLGADLFKTHPAMALINYTSMIDLSNNIAYTYGIKLIDKTDEAIVHKVVNLTFPIITKDIKVGWFDLVKHFHIPFYESKIYLRFYSIQYGIGKAINYCIKQLYNNAPVIDDDIILAYEMGKLIGEKKYKK